MRLRLNNNQVFSAVTFAVFFFSHAAVGQLSEMRVTKTAPTKDLTPIVRENQPSSGDVDVIGLKLGMSPSEAETVLRAYQKDFTFKYDRKELYGSTRVIGSMHAKDRVIANTKYLSSLIAKGTGFSWTPSPGKKGDWVFLVFSAPPSENKLIHIQRTKGYGGAGPTTEAYDNAFIKKYGTQFFTYANSKIVRFVSGETVVDNDSNRCFQYATSQSSNLLAFNPTRRNEVCGLVLGSTHTVLGNDTPIVNQLRTVLTDVNMLHNVYSQTNKLISDNNEKIKSDRIKAASENSADIF